MPNAGPCPLTSLQAQILLRQNLLPYFNNELAQDLRFQGPEWVDMLPLTVGPNGVNYGRQSMYIPTFLAENIKCCRRITHRLGPKGTNPQILDIIPVLCRSPERAQLGNFTYGTTGDLLYAVQPTEVAVNLIDLSAVESSATYYLDVNTEPYAALVTSWNEWIATLQTVLSSLVPLSGEGGACALSTLPYTNFQRTVVAPVAEPNEPVTTAGKVVVGKALEKKGSRSKLSVGAVIPRKNKGVGAAPVPGSSYLDTVGDSSTSSLLGFNKHFWSFIGIMILPVSWSDDGLGISATSCVQAFQCEGSSVPRSSTGLVTGGGNAPTAEERLNIAAAVDVKTVTQDGDHVLIQQLKLLTAHGEGGFFTSIAGMIGDAFGVPEVRSVANAIGKVTGL